MGIKLFKVRAKDIAYLCGAFLLFSSCVDGAKECAAEENPVVYADTINFHFATIEEGRTLITTEDNYARNLSKFDIIARLQNPQGTEVELTDLSVRSLREWTEEEKEKIKIMMYAINDSIRKNNFRLPLPPTITLVKSTLEEEGGAAGYTRSNWIALTDRLFTHLPESFHTTLLLHELFHVLTRNSIEFKREMYATIGFTVENQELEYPQDLLNLRISNPDIDKYDSYATFMVDGEAQKCAMILYADKPYTSGNFFEYMTVGFVPYDEQMMPVQESGKTLIYPMEKIDNFYEKIGKNTSYIIHPEEILAENFVIAFTNASSVPTPELKEKIRKILKNK